LHDGEANSRGNASINERNEMIYTTLFIVAALVIHAYAAASVTKRAAEAVEAVKAKTAKGYEELKAKAVDLKEAAVDATEAVHEAADKVRAVCVRACVCVCARAPRVDVCEIRALIYMKILIRVCRPRTDWAARSMRRTTP
jgi:hypothetical protein